MHPSLLHVVSPLSNQVRFNRRYDLFDRFAKHMVDSKVNLTVAECAYGDREHFLTPHEAIQIVQLRTRHELWHKENMINLAVQRLPADWKYIAWVDGDVQFLNPNWAAETVQQLQHYDLVQMFDFAEDIGFGPHQHLNIERSFMLAYHNMLRGTMRGEPRKPNPHGKHPYGGWWGHTGYAWAARRSAWDKLGGLIDSCILGSADHTMACALIGSVKSSFPPQTTAAFQRGLIAWGDRAENHILRNVGYVPGKILHHFHGPKANRDYVGRWEILKRNSFNPDTDLKRDWQGLWQLTGNKPRLRDELRMYFRQRNEDSNDLGGVRA
jgi:hypothetical protein